MIGFRPAVVSLALVLAACGSRTISGMGTGGTGGSLAPGSPCKADSQCASMACGGGNCCAAVCSTADAVCGAVGCDDAGACVYPSAGTSCPGTVCSGSMLSQKACDGAGACVPEKIGTACPGSYACGIDGCGTSCSSSTYCATGFVCNAGLCVEPIEVGTCTENDDCASAICGIAGTGSCCRDSCTTADASCGATGCDETGACVYPAATTVCGTPHPSCTGSTQTSPTLCDGLGNCGGPMLDCSPFTCESGACKTSCASDADCVTGRFCDASKATCCPELAPGDTIAVDSVLGDDSVACCGMGSAIPCRSLTHAMALVAAGPAQSTVLQVTVDGGASGDWTAPGELYPIGLGWGVELSAPGIFFQGTTDAGSPFASVDAIFALAADAGGGESASIVGTPTSPVGIGMSERGDQLISDAAILIGQGSTLYLANASVNGSAWDESYAIYASGTLVLGQDRAGAVAGTVRIGNDLADVNTDGHYGIECNGCTLSDAPMNGTSSVVITGQQAGDIYAEGPASISLTSAPVFGVTPSSVGFNTCPSKSDGVGISVEGPVTMSLDHATIQCIAVAGISVDGYDGGIPSLSINDTTIQNTSVALSVYNGSAVVSNSTIRYNIGGVEQELAGTVDLSGGAVGGRNTVACSSRVESGYALFAPISVLNQTNTALNASNVDWDTPAPDLFGCASNLVNCACLMSSCTDSPDGGEMDAVVMYDGGTIITTGNGLSPLNCAVPPGN